MIPTIDKCSYPLRAFACFHCAFHGFYTGIRFVGETNSTNPNGLVEHYNGNEDEEDTMVMNSKRVPKKC